MAKDAIEITILNNKRHQECDAGCGPDWSSPETIALAKLRIKDRFGDKIRLAYLDLSETSRDTSAWNREIEEKNLSLPLLLLNGKLRLSGQFDIRQLLDAVEAEMEIKA